MTKQEAQVLATRLKRIWAPELCSRLTFKENLLAGGLKKDGDKISFYAEGKGAFYLRDFSWYYWCACLWDGNIVLPEYIEGSPRKAALDRFAAQWLPTFRRGCFLSGLPIEASAHERAEWMQGFRREELEAWNLKM